MNFAVTTSTMPLPLSKWMPSQRALCSRSTETHRKTESASTWVSTWNRANSSVQNSSCLYNLIKTILVAMQPNSVLGSLFRSNTLTHESPPPQFSSQQGVLLKDPFVPDFRIDLYNLLVSRFSHRARPWNQHNHRVPPRTWLPYTVGKL